MRLKMAAFARPNSTPHKAFTLVELLVVIGIIGVLISILLPTLSKVRQQAAATKCAANLRGFAQAWQMYCENSKGISPPGRMPYRSATGDVWSVGNEEGYRPRWYELLGAMVKKYAIAKPFTQETDSWQVESEWFICPTVPDWTNSRNYPFGYNYQFLGNTQAKPGSSTGFVNYPVKQSSISKPSETVMAADSAGTAARLPIADRKGYLADGTRDPDAMGNKGWALDPPRLTGASDYADGRASGDRRRSGPDARHAGKLNVGFCDGSVRRMSIEEMGYLVEPGGAVAFGSGNSGPKATNRYFSGRGDDRDPPAAQ
jgi:prepilin-type N-terminal cleavage/methylation domain-containing protein/prepilin-type processing-associated H-X9-DG protein